MTVERERRTTWRPSSIPDGLGCLLILLAGVGAYLWGRVLFRYRLSAIPRHWGRSASASHRTVARLVTGWDTSACAPGVRGAGVYGVVVPCP